MSEGRREIKQAPPSVYRWELNKLQAKKAREKAFDGLVDSVPEERKKALTPVLQGLRDSSQKNLLDPDKMQELSERDKGLYEEVDGYYTRHLKKLAGIE